MESTTHLFALQFVFFPIESHLDLFLNTTSAAVCLYWCTNMLTSDTLTAHTGKDNTEKPTVDYTVLHLHACIHIQECSFIRVHMISKSCSFIKNSTSAWCVNSEWGGRICQWAYEKNTHTKKNRSFGLCETNQLVASGVALTPIVRTGSPVQTCKAS